MKRRGASIVRSRIVKVDLSKLAYPPKDFKRIEKGDTLFFNPFPDTIMELRCYDAPYFLSPDCFEIPVESTTDPRAVGGLGIYPDGSLSGIISIGMGRETVYFIRSLHDGGYNAIYHRESAKIRSDRVYPTGRRKPVAPDERLRSNQRALDGANRVWRPNTFHGSRPGKKSAKEIEFETAASAPFAICGTDCESLETNIDIIVAFTEEARLSESGGTGPPDVDRASIRKKINDSVRLLNVTFRESDSPSYPLAQFRVRVVHSYELPAQTYPDDVLGTTTRQHRDRVGLSLTGNSNFFYDAGGVIVPGLSARREIFAADLAVLVTSTGDLAGMSSLLKFLRDPKNPDYNAGLTVAWDSLAGTIEAEDLTFAHEICHTLGCRHESAIDLNDLLPCVPGDPLIRGHAYREAENIPGVTDPIKNWTLMKLDPDVDPL
jgi:hypothetical protein